MTETAIEDEQYVPYSTGVNIVRIDHDVDYNHIDRDYIRYLVSKLPERPAKCYIRKSCGGNTHIMLNFNNALSEIQIFFIRAVMRDDSRRLRADMERYILCTREVEFCFSEKLINGEIQRAGEWIEFPF